MDTTIGPAPAFSPLAPSALPPVRALLFGRDDMPGIVSVMANRSGQARVWRRIDGSVVCEEATFPNWFLLARRDLLDGLPVTELPPSILETVPSPPPPLRASKDLAIQPGRSPQDRPAEWQRLLAVVRLQGHNPFQYLVLTDHLDEVESHVSQAVHAGHEAGTIDQPLSHLVLVRPPVEQYLILTGRTYFKGMVYSDIRRLQFDLETTGLSHGEDRIFMVSIKDSHGFSELLDIGRMSEADLIREFVRIVRDRDPDVIENHNIFDFDIKFLIHRARALGVPLPLGRDGSAFSESRDSVKIGAETVSFTRYSLAGREIIDTLHATRRHGAIHRDMRRHGLKAAAQYFGIAADDREYVDGPDIWRVFQEDPERVRRYCFDDVEEVDRISPILLAPAFALASMVPRPYERIATAGTVQGLIEPLLLRAYVAGAHSLPVPSGSGSFQGATTAVFTTGVVHNVVKADVASLYPSIMLADGIAPTSDRMGAFLALLEELTQLRLHHKAEALLLSHRSGGGSGRAAPEPVEAAHPEPVEAAHPEPVEAAHPEPVEGPHEYAYHDALQSAMKVLINSFYGMLGADFALFCDKAAAERVTARGRAILQLVLDGLRGRGATLIEADTDGVLFSLPPHPNGGEWTYVDEVAFIDNVARDMPAGILLEHDGRYRAMYSYREKNYALLDYDHDAVDGFQARKRIRLVGVAFRSTKGEPLLETFLAEALTRILVADYQGVRAAYREVCAQLWARQVPVADLCVSMPLTKTPQKYAESGRKEEAYEVNLAAGNTDWRPGTRVRYYQSKRGKRLLETGTSDYDAEFYIQRLRATCMQRLDRAFAPDHLDFLFRESDGLFDPPISEIVPLCVTRDQPLAPEEAAAPPPPVEEGWGDGDPAVSAEAEWAEADPHDLLSPSGGEGRG